MIELKIIHFIPKRAELNFFERNREKNKNIKIFNSNAFVTDDLPNDNNVPEWLSMVSGTISSANFPINTSRVFLLGKANMNFLVTMLPECIAEMFKKLEGDSGKLKKFHIEFAPNIELAVKQYTDVQQDAFAKFLRYATNQDSEKMISLGEYLGKVQEDQKQKLFLTGFTRKEVETSLHLEGFRAA